MINYLIILFLLISTCLNGIDLEIQEMMDCGTILFLVHDKDSGKKVVLSLPYEDYILQEKMNNLNPYLLFVKFHQNALSLEDAQYFFSLREITEENYIIHDEFKLTD